MEFDVRLFIEQANSYLSNILTINLLLFIASAILFILSYKYKFKTSWWVIHAAELILGVCALTIILKAQRGLLTYIATRSTDIDVDLSASLGHLWIVYWIDLLWLLFITIRGCYLITEVSKK